MHHLRISINPKSSNFGVWTCICLCRPVPLPSSPVSILLRTCSKKKFPSTLFFHPPPPKFWLRVLCCCCCCLENDTAVSHTWLTSMFCLIYQLPNHTDTVPRWPQVKPKSYLQAGNGSEQISWEEMKPKATTSQYSMPMWVSATTPAISQMCLC